MKVRKVPDCIYSVIIHLPSHHLAITSIHTTQSHVKVIIPLLLEVTGLNISLLQKDTEDTCWSLYKIQFRVSTVIKIFFTICFGFQNKFNLGQDEDLKHIFISIFCSNDVTTTNLRYMQKKKRFFGGFLSIFIQLVGYTIQLKMRRPCAIWPQISIVYKYIYI